MIPARRSGPGRAGAAPSAPVRKIRPVRGTNSTREAPYPVAGTMRGPGFVDRWRMNPERTAIDEGALGPATYERFLRHFTRDQQRLLAYILTLVHDRDDAQEIFQETSLVLWRAFPTFRP